jgi:hypothetical protein
MSELNQIINNKALNLNFSGLLDNLRKLSGAEFETLSLVFDQDQFEMLLGSLKEAQEGKVVTLKEAFSDLN